jgi:hypothetical protein
MSIPHFLRKIYNFKYVTEGQHTYIKSTHEGAFPGTKSSQYSETQST